MSLQKHAPRAQVLVLLLAGAILVGCGSAPAATPGASPSIAALPVASASASAQPSTSVAASASVAAASAASANPYAAAQTVLDFYAAINQQQYDAAYAQWARDGAASNQTLEQFRAGYAGTVQSAVQLGALPAAAGATVAVPVTVIAVVNDASAPNGQRVQEFAGTYTVEQSGGSWKLGGAQIAETQSPALPPVDRADATALLNAYYDAIGRGEYGRAYTYWNNGGRGSAQSLADFAAGFAGTTAVKFAAGAAVGEGAAGSTFSTVPVVIAATEQDGAAATFCGTYTLRRLNVAPFDQLGWRIEGAQIAPTDAVTLGSAEANALLAGGCTAR